jgi:hypothetical protein
VLVSDRLPTPGAIVVGGDKVGTLWLVMHDGQDWNCMERGGFDAATRIVRWYAIALVNAPGESDH